MGSAANPMFSGVVPGGMNPTGNQLALLDVLPGSSKGANPLLPAMTPGGPSSTVNTNPYDIVSSSTPGVRPTAMTSPSATSPTFGANAGPYPTGVPGATSTTGGAAGTPAQFGGFLSGMTSKDISRLFDSLKKTYGDGMAHMLLDFLQGGAGFNQQAINNLFASLQPGIERGEEDLMSQFSASGNRFGSGAQIGLGDFLSRVNLNEGELETQMYESALNNFIEVMMGTATKGADRIAASPTGLDSILAGIGLGGKAAGGASAAISAVNPGADTSILDAIAGAAAFA